MGRGGFNLPYQMGVCCVIVYKKLKKFCKHPEKNNKKKNLHYAQKHKLKLTPSHSNKSTFSKKYISFLLKFCQNFIRHHINWKLFCVILWEEKECTFLLVGATIICTSPKIWIFVFIWPWKLKYYFESYLIYIWRYFRQTIINQLNIMVS